MRRTFSLPELLLILVIIGATMVVAVPRMLRAEQFRRPMPIQPILSITLKGTLHSGENQLLTITLKGMEFNLKELRCQSSDEDIAYIGNGELWLSGILPGQAKIQCSYRGVWSNKIEVETTTLH